MLEVKGVAVGRVLGGRQVESPCELTVDSPATSSTAGAFKVHPKVDQSSMYKQVHLGSKRAPNGFLASIST